MRYTSNCHNFALVNIIYLNNMKMKKLFFCLAFVLMASANTIARELIPLTISREDKSPIGHHTPKSPIQPPTVYIEDYALSFITGHPDYILNIKDEDGDTVYTTTVYSAQTQVTLPSTLSGNYEIELVMGYWVFTGIITL